MGGFTSPPLAVIMLMLSTTGCGLLLGADACLVHGTRYMDDSTLPGG